MGLLQRVFGSILFGAKYHHALSTAFKDNSARNAMRHQGDTEWAFLERIAKLFW